MFPTLNGPSPDTIRRSPTGSGDAMKLSFDLAPTALSGAAGPGLVVGVAGTLRIAAVGGPRLSRLAVQCSNQGKKQKGRLRDVL